MLVQEYHMLAVELYISVENMLELRHMLAHAFWLQVLTSRPKFSKMAYEVLTSRPNFSKMAYEVLTSRPNFSKMVYEVQTSRPNFSMSAYEVLTSRPKFSKMSNLYYVLNVDILVLFHMLAVEFYMLAVDLYMLVVECHLFYGGFVDQKQRQAFQLQSVQIGE